MAARLACCCCCLLLWPAGASGAPRGDRLAAHMQALYARARDGGPLLGANTVRGFRAGREIVAQKPLYCFNLSSVQDSELILAATFHFFSEKCSHGHPKAVCRCSKNSACHLLRLPLMLWLNLVFHSFGENLAYGQLKENITVFPHRQEAWQMKDISHIVKRSKQFGELLLCVELDSGKRYRGVSEEAASHWPYIVVYANDLAIAEPNSVALSLQRYNPFPSAESLLLNASMTTRMKRDMQPSIPVQNNELPGTVDANNKQNEQGFWGNAYKSLKSKASRRDRKRKGPEDAEMLAESQVLNFDKKTMRKAQQKQWNEPAVCSRRRMKVDFADIGWNEWVISPKSFEAYYCAGACEFPMPKIVRPSNHATIQSIVKAVGIIPGIPEPSCVPNTMNSLSVLFLDESNNVVLKVYPNMSVDSCACR
ncbi:growth/differentiation factor 10 [Eublepharis macularius]|uniref:Growth/differentiation factor 10 n=1 Tax=Eublepharis macularius TaxID=481883 RepID=A0AA97JMQ3_EUBMA|nr:growth/differentiation factor 10 [Eublepharis macularius]